MLTRLKSIFLSPGSPSALLVIGAFGTYIYILHLLPEDGTIERLSFTSSSATFRRGGATEQSREQIGTVVLHAGDGETATSFLDDVETRVRILWNDFMSSSPAHPGGVETNQVIQNILRPAALEAIHEREGRERSMNATQTYPVFVVQITRPRPGRILEKTYNQPTSIAE